MDEAATATPFLDFPAGPPEAHLHLLRLDALAGLDEAELVRRYVDLLSPEERARRDRFLTEKSRRQYLMTRALVRTVLSRYAPVERRDWRFGANPYGRPFVTAPALDSRFDFNLSTADGLIVCLVARLPGIGVDVEFTPRPVEVEEVADRFFSKGEAASLRALPPHARRERFFACWTLKEAYIKARGMGLALPLDAFSFDLGGTSVDISFQPPIIDDPGAWQFRRWEFSADHVGATAIRVEPGDPVVFRTFEELPPAAGG